MIFYIQHLIFVSLFLGLTLCVGYTILQLLKIPLERDYQSAFLVFLVGLFSIVTLFSILNGGFRTVLSGLLIIGLFLFYDSVKFQAAVNKNTLTYTGLLSFLLGKWLEMIIVAGLIIFYRYGFVNQGSYFIEPAYPDYVFYSKLSKYLLEVGLENTHLDYFTNETSVTPYHYFDVWLNSFFIWATGTNAVGLMIYSTYTVGLTGIWLGFIGLLEKYWSAGFFLKLAGIALLFVCGLYLGDIISSPFIVSTGIFTRNALNYSKLFPLYLIIIVALQTLSQRPTSFTISLILCLPILNISTTPGAFILCGIIFLTNGIITRKIDWITIIKVLCMGLFFLIFYTVGVNSPSGGSWTFRFDNYVNLEYWITVRNIVTGAAIQFAIIFLPFLAVVFFIGRNRILFLTKHLMVVGFVYFSFIIPWAAFHSNPNSVQLFSNFFSPFFSCFVVFSFGKLFNEDKSPLANFLIWVCLIGFSFFALFLDARERYNLKMADTSQLADHPEYIDFFKKLKNPVGVYFNNEYSWASKASTFGALDASFQQYVDLPRFHTMSLSVFEMPLDSTSLNYDYEVNLVWSSIFGQFVLRKNPGLNGKRLRPEQVLEFQIQFLLEQQTEYILTNFNYVLPKEIDKNAQLIFSDRTLNRKAYLISVSE